MGYRWNGTVTKGTLGTANWTYNVGDPSDFLFFSPDNHTGYTGYAYVFVGHRTLQESTSQKELEAFYNQLQSKNFFPFTTYKTAYLVTKGTLDEPNGREIYQNIKGEIVNNRDYERAIVRESRAFDSVYHIYDGFVLYDDSKEHRVSYGIPTFDDKTEMEKWLSSDSAFIDSGGDSSIAAKGSYDGYLYLDGLSRYYEIDSNNYSKLGKAIQGGIFSGNIAEGIIDIKGLTTPGPLIEQTTTTIFKDVEGKPITVQGQEFDFGTFKFNERFRNFLDYGESTSIKLYLPYCGIQTLDPSIVMGGNVRLKGIVDIISGNILYYLTIENSDLSTSSTSVIYNWNGNVSCELPIGAEDYGSKVSSIVSSTIQTAGSLAIAPTGVGAALSTASATNNIASAVLSNKYVNVGSIASNNGMGGVQYPFIMITVPIAEYPSNYAHTVGYPSQQTHTINSLLGYTKVADVHLTGFTNATNDELKEIDSILKSGFIA